MVKGTRVNSKKFDHQSLIKLSNWAKLNRDVISVPDVDKTIYYLPANEKTTITNEEIKRYENFRFHSFDIYKFICFSIWCISLPYNAEIWTKTTCTCPSFHKN